MPCDDTHLRFLQESTVTRTTAATRPAHAPPPRSRLLRGRSPRHMDQRQAKSIATMVGSRTHAHQATAAAAVGCGLRCAAATVAASGPAAARRDGLSRGGCFS